LLVFKQPEKKKKDASTGKTNDQKERRRGGFAHKPTGQSKKGKGSKKGAGYGWKSKNNSLARGQVGGAAEAQKKGCVEYLS